MNHTVSSAHEKTCQLIWTGIILSFFLIQAIIWTVALALTANDPSHAVIADYEQKALNWDQSQSERLASAALGWQADLNVDSHRDVRSYHPLELVLRDRDGRPLETAGVTLQAFHTGRAADVQRLELTPTDPGRYTGKIRVERAGYWQFNGRIEIGDQLFLLDQRLRLED